MFFRNLTLFRFAPAVADTLDDLDTALESQRLQACGAMEMVSRGVVSPLGGEGQPLTRAYDAFTLLSVGSEEKLLPAAVVNQELARRVDRITSEEGRQVSGRERKKLKAEVLDELLPRALARPSRLNAYLDRGKGWLVLDTASRKAAENAVSTVREALGSFPAVPLAPEQSPRQLMTDWLASGELPAGLALADECELREPDGGAVVRCRHQELASGEVREHLRNGKQVSQLGLSFDDRMSFVLGEDLVVRKLRFHDDVTDELETGDSAADELDARFALMTGELATLLGRMSEWFGLSRPADA